VTALIEASRQAGEHACDVVFQALAHAGPEGLSPADARTASGLPERRYQRAVTALVDQGRVRRDGRRRVFAVVDHQGAPVDVRDAASRASDARDEDLTLATRRGWVLGEITDALTVLDGRQGLPLGYAPKATGLREFLRELARMVRTARTTSDLETLVGRAHDGLDQVNRLASDLAAHRQSIQDLRAVAAGQRGRIQDSRKRLIADRTRVRRWIDESRDHMYSSGDMAPVWVHRLSRETVDHRPLFTVTLYELPTPPQPTMSRRLIAVAIKLNPIHHEYGALVQSSFNNMEIQVEALYSAHAEAVVPVLTRAQLTGLLKIVDDYLTRSIAHHDTLLYQLQHDPGSVHELAVDVAIAPHQPHTRELTAGVTTPARNTLDHSPHTPQVTPTALPRSIQHYLQQRRSGA
jgi:hypothetical protein